MSQACTVGPRMCVPYTKTNNKLYCYQQAKSPNTRHEMILLCPTLTGKFYLNHIHFTHFSI